MAKITDVKPSWIFAALMIIIAASWMLWSVRDSNARMSDPNYYGSKDMQNLATRIHELHQDVYTLQTQVAKQDSR